MVTNSDQMINARIVEMRKNKFGLYRIHKWLSQWDNFSQLDEMLVLAHILNVCDRQNLAVTRNEVLYTFNKFYNPGFHVDKRGYLHWLYKEFHVRSKSVVSVERSHRVITIQQKPVCKDFEDIVGASRGQVLEHINNSEKLEVEE